MDAKENDMKIVAVDIDNVMNNFAETLADTDFPYDKSYGLSHEEFDDYLALIKNDSFQKSEFLTSKFSDFRYRIHAQCYRSAKANWGAVEFMRWLKDSGWNTVICTKRDLRLTGEITKKWLQDNKIAYDYLFMAVNKILFCKLWNINHLIDDDVFNIINGEVYGVKVYYPVMPKYYSVIPGTAKGFTSFEELKHWMKE